MVEAGLGGRYDATNVIPSRVQVLTGVGLEHTRWLGPTLADIAEEKLAVVHDHATLVAGDLDPESRRSPRAWRPSAARGWSRRRAIRGGRRCAPPGAFQRGNFALAAAAAEALLGRAARPRRRGAGGGGDASCRAGSTWWPRRR